MEVKSQYSQEDHTLKAVDVQREAAERAAFENSKFVQKEIMKAFKEVKRQEYDLLKNMNPSELKGEKEAVDRAIKLEENTRLNIDSTKLASERGAYLERLKKEAS